MKILKIREVKTPSRGTKFSAGLDFYIPSDLGWDSKLLRHGESILIPSGIKAKVPNGYALIALEKSGLALKGCSVAAKVIDSDYLGEIHLHVFNHNRDKELVIKANEKLLQFLLIPIELCSIEVVSDAIELSDGELSERGEGGFGSTGLL